MGQLETRLEKITFLVREIDLASHLAQLCAGNDELARIWARRVVIRCADLIDHTEAVRRDVIALDASAYPPLKRARVAYDALFEDQFRVVRDRIAAHAQDLGMVERLELWNGIDAANLSVFVDGAREIHDRCLGGLGLPTFVPFVAFPERTDRSLADLVRAYVGRLPTGPAFGVDAYAGARPNTVTLINTTRVHQRAQLIAALRRWARAVAPFALDARVPLNARRIACASLITDVVALGDSIYTRTAGGTASDEALDRLVERPGSDVIARWDSTTHLRAMLDALRECRNTVAAHLEVDPVVGLHDLLARLDAVDPQGVARTFDRVAGLFHQICTAEDYLSSYTSDGSSLRGVLSVTHGGVHRPYDPTSSQHAREIDVRRVDATDAAAIDAALDEWCATGSAELRSALWDLSGDGPIVEVMEVGSRRIELRLFHERFTSKVSTADHPRFARLMELAGMLGTNSPVPLVEALLRGVEARDADLTMRALAADALSRIPLRAGESPRVDGFLRAVLAHDLDVAHPAVLALYQLENVTAPTAEPIAMRVLAALGERDIVDRAIAIGALISRVWSGRTHREPSALEADARALVDAVGAVLPAGTSSRVADQACKLARGDTVGFLLTVAEELSLDAASRARIYRAAISPALALPADVCLRRSARMNRAVALHRLGMNDAACALCIEVLQSLDYSRPVSCLGAVEHAAACGVDPRKWVCAIREACVLAPDELARLDALAP